MEPRLAFTLKLSVKIPSTGLRGILDEAVTPRDGWNVGYTLDNHECASSSSSSTSYRYASSRE